MHIIQIFLDYQQQKVMKRRKKRQKLKNKILIYYNISIYFYLLQLFNLFIAFSFLYFLSRRFFILQIVVNMSYDGMLTELIDLLIYLFITIYLLIYFYFLSYQLYFFKFFNNFISKHNKILLLCSSLFFYRLFFILIQ